MIPKKEFILKNIQFYVVHANVTEEHWWRGCKYAYDEKTECTQHSFFHHDHNVTVDECVCRGDWCNKDMLPVIGTTSLSLSLYIYIYIK